MPDRDILHHNLPRCFLNLYGELCEERNWDAEYMGYKALYSLEIQ